jgi:hypothetical protein
MIVKAVVPVGCRPGTPNGLFRETRMLWLMALPPLLAAWLSGEIEDWDLSRAVGFDFPSLVALPNLNHTDVLSESNSV